MMRAVALSDDMVQDKVTTSFIPLKIAIDPGTREFPLDWPALRHWSRVYRLMGGAKCQGITACTVVSPDLQVEYGSTGSALVWELFESIAYDAGKFAAMLDRASERAERERAIRADEALQDTGRQDRLAAFRRQLARVLAREGRFHLPPKGFTIKGALELFEMTGDLPEDGGAEGGGHVEVDLPDHPHTGPRRS